MKLTIVAANDKPGFFRLCDADAGVLLNSLYSSENAARAGIARIKKLGHVPARRPVVPLKPWFSRC